VVAGLLLWLTAARGWLARIAGLRWAHAGGLDLGVPAAIGLVIWCALPQLGRDFAGMPFGVVWCVATATVVAPLRLFSRPRRPERPSPGSSTFALTLVVGIVVSWVLYDILFWQQTIQLYDLQVYLGSAARWLDGGQPYMTAPVTTWPADARADFFLYPPPLLPFFAALSRLPAWLADAGWVALLVACAYRSFRLLGLPRIWSVALLAFPPVAIGFESGNVASLTFLLFAASVRAGGALVVDGLFKVQSALPALWLVRQRRWRGILAGTAALTAIVVITLPLVGIDSWRAWWAGLGYRAASQASVPALYGYSYAGALPAELFTAMCVVLVGLALLLRGRPGLAALGLASIFASPSLWPHGFVFALPAVLMLESGPVVWLLLGAGAFGPNMWLLFGGGWFALVAARRLPSGALHPLAGTDGPWPGRRGHMPTGRSNRSVARVSAGRTADPEGPA
jgi:hypothetical protein